MNKIVETGNEFVGKEVSRLQKLLKGKVTAVKKNELTERLNIIQSFEVKAANEEL